MPGLNASLNIAIQALMAQQGAISATANNIANVNTTGYSRQRAILSQATPTQEGDLVYGNGVTLDGIESIRDRLLELRIQQETQKQGFSQEQLSALQQVQTVFSSSAGISNSMSAFFSSLQKLSNDATSQTAREGVLTAAKNLVNSFHETVAKLQDIQSNLNLKVVQDVNNVNQIMQQIADLNVQVAHAKALGTDPGTLEDQRTELMRQLSQLIDVSDIQTDQGDTLTTANGMGLVVGSMAFKLTAASVDNGAMQHVFAQGQDITDKLYSGEIGGALSIRDQFIPEIISRLNALASSFATSFNAVHTTAYQLDTDGDPTTLPSLGANFFEIPVTAQAAASIQINSAVAADYRKIAVSSDGSSGSNGKLEALIAVGKEPIATYSQLVFDVGNEAAQAKAEYEAADMTVSKLQNERDAVSGVSIDEESANLMRYQHAYQAAAKIVSTVDELLQTVLGMGGR